MTNTPSPGNNVAGGFATGKTINNASASHCMFIPLQTEVE